MKLDRAIQYEVNASIIPLLELANNRNMNIISMYCDSNVSRIVISSDKRLPVPREYLENGIKMTAKIVYTIPFEPVKGSFLSRIQLLDQQDILPTIDRIYLGENNVMILVPH